MIYFQDDLVTLYLGNCLEITEWNQAKVLITDPPYGMNRRFLSKNKDVRVAGDKDTTARDQVMALWGIEKPFIVFGHWKVAKPINLKHCVIWDKEKMALGDKTSAFATNHEEIYIGGNTADFIGKREQTVIRCRPELNNNRPDHPSAKPLSLMTRLVLKTNLDFVADPFAGSGTTLIAAKLLGKKAIGVEIDEKYAEIAANRLSQESLF